KNAKAAILSHSRTSPSLPSSEGTPEAHFASRPPTRYDNREDPLPTFPGGRRRMSAATTAALTHTTAPVYVKPPAPKNRLGSRWYNRLLALVGLPWQRRLAWGALQVPRVRELESKYDALTVEELKTAGLKLRGRARGGESLDRLLPEAFALVCVASKRMLQLRPYDVQL